MTQAILTTLANVAVSVYALGSIVGRAKTIPAVHQSKLAEVLAGIDAALGDLVTITVPLLSPPQHRPHNRHKHSVNGVRRVTRKK